MAKWENVRVGYWVSEIEKETVKISWFLFYWKTNKKLERFFFFWDHFSELSPHKLDYGRYTALQAEITLLVMRSQAGIPSFWDLYPASNPTQNQQKQWVSRDCMFRYSMRLCTFVSESDFWLPCSLLFGIGWVFSQPSVLS